MKIRKRVEPALVDSDPLWYKDAIIYEVHVRAFCDSNADGIGDFRGLVQKLDYLQDLGVTALWLLPFYPSPLRDDGYDIADYTDVNPIYGNLADFKLFLARGASPRPARHHRAGHQPHLGPASLVPARPPIARRAAPWRDFYVWSDTPTSSRKPGSSSRISSIPTGPGTRWPRPTTGTAFTRTSRT